MTEVRTTLEGCLKGDFLALPAAAGPLGEKLRCLIWPEDVRREILLAGDTFSISLDNAVTLHINHRVK